MARETIAQRNARLAAEREAAYLASRIPATIADVRTLQAMVRHERRRLVDDRAHLVENMRWLARSLTQEADNLEQYPDREPSESVVTGSLVHDVAREANIITTRGRSLGMMVRELESEGVTFPTEA